MKQNHEFHLDIDKGRPPWREGLIDEAEVDRSRSPSELDLYWTSLSLARRLVSRMKSSKFFLRVNSFLCQVHNGIQSCRESSSINEILIKYEDQLTNLLWRLVGIILSAPHHYFCSSNKKSPNIRFKILLELAESQPRASKCGQWSKNKTRVTILILRDFSLRYPDYETRWWVLCSVPLGDIWYLVGWVEG